MSKNAVVFLLLVGFAAYVAVELFSPRAGEGLSVGATAPDFSGVAVDGQVVRLSDLRGKVVVVDFWATWCGPCRGMVPHERELVSKLRGKPFAFIGISADHTVADLRKVLADERITWLNIFDGPNGSILRQYDVSSLPTIYVLDRDGVIRFKDVRGADLDKAVDKLLAETH